MLSIVLLLLLLIALFKWWTYYIAYRGMSKILHDKTGLKPTDEELKLAVTWAVENAFRKKKL